MDEEISIITKAEIAKQIKTFLEIIDNQALWEFAFRDIRSDSQINIDG